jgi:hypothetical protein
MCQHPQRHGRVVTALTHSGTTAIVFSSLLLCLLSVAPVWAAGRAERESRARLQQAEALIEQKRYDEALELLKSTVEENPDSFEAAQKLVQRVLLIREQYNDKFAELMDALFNQNDVTRAIQLIEELRALDPNPNPRLARVLDQAMSAREIVYYLNQFNELMVRARALLDGGEYLQAMALYVGGFEINRNRFEAANYGNIVKDAVHAALAELSGAVDEFGTLDAEVGRSAQGLPAAPSALPGAVAAARETLLRQMELKAAVERAGHVFQTQNEQLRASGAQARSDLFLLLAIQLVFGREKEQAEGIGYAMDAAWRQRLGTLQAKLLEGGRGRYEAALDDFEGGAYEESRQGLAGARAYFDSALQLYALWPVRVQPGATFTLSGEGQAAMEEALPGFLLAQQSIRATRDFEELIGIALRSAELGGQAIASAEQLNTIRREIAALEQSALEKKPGWLEWIANLREAEALGLELQEQVARAQEVVSALDGTVEKLVALDINYLDRIVDLQAFALDSRFEELQKQYLEAVPLQEGVEVALPSVTNEQGQPVEQVRVEKYPSRALQAYRSVAAGLAEVEREGKALLDSTQQNPEYLQRNAQLKTRVQVLGDVLGRALALEAELAQRQAAAEQAAIQAERFRSEGLLRIQQVQTYTQRGQYATARETLANAQDALDRSLDLQEDREVRRIRDEGLPELSRRIAEAENAQVVREVRALINSGRDLFVKGDFIGAEMTLNRAQARWKDTHAEDNPEVNTWLTLVRSAVTAASGREIALTNPLYKDMSQLYNLAYADYLAGKKLVEAGNKGEALRVLKQADERIARILVPFPYNAQARELSLRILQLTDREAFGRRLTEMFREAQDKRATSPQDAYALLKDIERLQPNYPNLASTLYSVEVALGLKAKPPDPVDTARSRDLYLAAKAIYDRGVPDLFPGALERLTEALRLNPDNGQAAELKDRIQLALGGTVENVLSRDDELLLTQAEGLYAERKYYQSLAIIEVLLKNPKNRNNPRVLDLEKRLRAQTG